MLVILQINLDGKWSFFPYSYAYQVTSVVSDSLWPYELYPSRPFQAAQSVRFSRQEYWSGLPCPSPGDLPDPGIELVSLVSWHWQVGSLPLAPPGKPKALCRTLKFVFILGDLRWSHIGSSLQFPLCSPVPWKLDLLKGISCLSLPPTSQFPPLASAYSLPISDRGASLICACGVRYCHIEKPSDLFKWLWKCDHVG